MDETPIYIWMPHSRTMHQVGDKTVYMASSSHKKPRYSEEGRVWLYDSS